MLRFFCDLPPTLNQSLMPVRIKSRKALIPDVGSISDTGSLFRDFGYGESEKLRLVHTPKARTFREAAFYLCLSAVNRRKLIFPKDERYGIILIVFLKWNSRDVDNNLKLIVDSVTDACRVGSDKNIFKLHVEKIINPAVNPHVWVEFGPEGTYITRLLELLQLSDSDKATMGQEFYLKGQFD